MPRIDVCDRCDVGIPRAESFEIETDGGAWYVVHERCILPTDVVIGKSHPNG